MIQFQKRQTMFFAMCLVTQLQFACNPVCNVARTSIMRVEENFILEFDFDLPARFTLLVDGLYFVDDCQIDGDGDVFGNHPATVVKREARRLGFETDLSRFAQDVVSVELSTCEEAPSMDPPILLLTEDVELTRESVEVPGFEACGETQPPSSYEVLKGQVHDTFSIPPIIENPCMIEPWFCGVDHVEL